MEFGDHVGDWYVESKVFSICAQLTRSREHNMIRFSNGNPQAIWYSQHAGGQAFTYEATEKQGKRPYAYSANGTHAVYVIAG
jgi:hypothetical protein